jgi:low affinity Fe/Cu permease
MSVRIRSAIRSIGVTEGKARIVPGLRAAFAKFSRLAAHLSGQPSTFILAVVVIILWAATGKYFDWSDTWQLIINTGTTIITFLMVFLIQNTQNHDAEALHLKINEIIRALDKASNRMIDLERGTEEDMMAAREAIDDKMRKNAND